MYASSQTQTDQVNQQRQYIEYDDYDPLKNDPVVRKTRQNYWNFRSARMSRTPAQFDTQRDTYEAKNTDKCNICTQNGVLRNVDESNLTAKTKRMNEFQDGYYPRSRWNTTRSFYSEQEFRPRGLIYTNPKNVSERLKDRTCHEATNLMERTYLHNKAQVILHKLSRNPLFYHNAGYLEYFRQ